MVEPSSRARCAPLAIPQPSRAPLTGVAPAGSQLALPSGEIAGDLRRLGTDWLRRIARYELRVANETDGPLIGFVYALERPHPGSTIDWTTVRVPMRSAVAVPLEFRIRKRPQRVVAELHAQGAHLTLDAEPARETSRGRRGLIAMAAGLLIVATSAAGYGFAQRHVAGVAVSSQGIAASSHNFVRSTAAQPRTKTRKLPSMLKPLAISVAEDIVAGGKPIVVRYGSDAGTGEVKLLDQDGTERASALLAKRGSSILIAPNVGAPQDFRVVVAVHDRSGVREAQAPVRIVPAPAHVADDDRTVGVAGASDSPIALAKTRYRSGDPITIKIRRHPSHMQVALLNDHGETLSRANVVAAEDRLQFMAPSVDDPTRMVIVATFGSSLGEENVIEPVLIKPAR